MLSGMVGESHHDALGEYAFDRDLRLRAGHCISHHKDFGDRTPLRFRQRPAGKLFCYRVHHADVSIFIRSNECITD